jgi:hypothetical protein
LSASVSLGQDVEPANSFEVFQPVAVNPRAAASEIFDRFFADRRYQEAEAVLQRSNKEQMFEWWRVRYERLKDIVTHDYRFDAGQLFKRNEKAPVIKDQFVSSNDAKQPDEHERMQPFSGDFRHGFVTEILAFASQAVEALTTPQDLKSQKQDASKTLSADFSANLSEKLLAMPIDTEQLNALFFDLMQSLAASSSGTSLIEIIEKKGLKDSSPQWHGLYLDVLLRCGFARKVIVEGLVQVEKQPKLTWIRVVWRRLPPAWAAMGVTGFTWSEDDGAKDFLDKINVRGQQLLRTFIDDNYMRL